MNCVWAVVLTYKCIIIWSVQGITFFVKYIEIYTEMYDKSIV